MRGFAATLCVVSILAMIPAPRAGGEIYRWVDAAGQLHFSQSLERIPADQRRGAIEAAQQRAKAGPDPLQLFDVKESAPARHAPRAYGAKRSIRVPFERHGTLMKVVARVNDRVDVPFYVDTGAIREASGKESAAPAHTEGLVAVGIGHL